MLRRWLIRIGLAAFALWLAAIGALLVFQRDLTYPLRGFARPDLPVGVPGARVDTVTAEDGTPLTVWVVPPRAGRPVILYFMGNAGTLALVAPRLAEFVHRGYGVVALNYRGAGGAPGEPSEPALVADALSVHAAIPDLLPGAEAPPVVYAGIHPVLDFRSAPRKQPPKRQIFAPHRRNRSRGCAAPAVQA